MEFSNARPAFPELFYIVISRRYKKLRSVRHHDGKTVRISPEMACAGSKTGLAQIATAG
ncbi:hypothetical protein [Mesorhizobium sp. KR1-2]|uniref:hypothetical protein n=1 Tax=Mesorhizobium sp. KR1-2 TaxID=3156609 RepID=UPI0032B5D147